MERLVEVAPNWVLQLPGVISPERADALRVRAVGAAGDSKLRELVDAVCSAGPAVPLLVLAQGVIDPDARDELAEAIGLSLAGAKARIARATRLLREKLHSLNDSSI